MFWSIGYSMVSTFTIRQPAGVRQDSFLHILLAIRDLVDCVEEVNISSMIVFVDSTSINRLLDNLQATSSAERNQNPYVWLYSPVEIKMSVEKCSFLLHKNQIEWTVKISTKLFQVISFQSISHQMEYQLCWSPYHHWSIIRYLLINLHWLNIEKIWIVKLIFEIIPSLLFPIYR